MALVENKKIHLNYSILKTYEAGLALSGNEVKAIRTSQAQILGAKIILRGGEAYLIGLNITPYQTTDKMKKSDRTIKLLLKKSEIVRLATEEAKKGVQILPVKIYDSHGLLKLELALVSNKNKQDKRETLKKKEFQREKNKFL